MAEKDTQAMILDYLRLRGHYPVRINTMGVPVWKKQELVRWRKSPLCGVSDILGVSKLGQFFAIEVKAPDGSATPEQLQFLEEVRRRKGISILAYNLDDVIKTGL